MIPVSRSDLPTIQTTPGHSLKTGIRQPSDPGHNSLAEHSRIRPRGRSLGCAPSLPIRAGNSNCRAASKLPVGNTTNRFGRTSAAPWSPTRSREASRPEHESNPARRRPSNVGLAAHLRSFGLVWTLHFETTRFHKTTWDAFKTTPLVRN